MKGNHSLFSFAVFFPPAARFLPALGRTARQENELPERIEPSFVFLVGGKAAKDFDKFSLLKINEPSLLGGNLVTSKHPL